MTGFWRRDWFLALLLIAATVIAHWPAMHGGFLWDDDSHISENMTLRSLDGLWKIWTVPGATMQYYPLSFSVFWADYHLWGLNTFGYHLQNGLLHGAAAVLLWQLLKRLQVPGALLAGAIFALHPVNVMSVAWMTELKNTLSGTLMLGAAWAYLRFAGLGVYNLGGKPGTNTATIDWRFYFLSLALFQLAMFAKTAVSFLPASLLLIVWWQRTRLRWRDVWPLLVMIGIVVAMGQVTFHVERQSGATGPDFSMGFLERVLVSGRAFWFYLGKLFFPCKLTFIYPRWTVDAGVWWQYLFPAATVAFLGVLWGLRRRIGRGPLAALLHFYIATSFLTLLLVLFMTRYSFVSDHWQYFGSMSVVALAAAGISLALGFLGKGKPWLRPLFCGALLLTLGVLTWQQSRIYVDREALWRDTLAKNPACWMAYNNLGLNFSMKGRFDEAISQFQEAIRLKPDNAELHDNLGNVLLNKDQTGLAIGQFQEAIRLKPDDAEAHYNLGNALSRKNQIDGAINEYQEAIRLSPNYAEAHNNLGVALNNKGHAEMAISQFQEAIRLKPDYADAYNNLGVNFNMQGRFGDAIIQFQEAIRLKPGDTGAQYNLAKALELKSKSNVKTSNP